MAFAGLWALAMSTHCRAPLPLWLTGWGLALPCGLHRTVTGCWTTQQGTLHQAEEAESQGTTGGTSEHSPRGALGSPFGPWSSSSFRGHWVRAGLAFVDPSHHFLGLGTGLQGGSGGTGTAQRNTHTSPQEQAVLDPNLHRESKEAELTTLDESGQSHG